MTDPLDENDHRDRLDWAGIRFIRHGHKHWHSEMYMPKPCNIDHGIDHGQELSLEYLNGGLGPLRLAPISGIKPELIEKARLLTDWDQHQYRVNNRIPRCVCGWTATEPYGLEGYDRHITETVLATVADDLRAGAWDEGYAAGASADMGDWEHPPDEYTNPYRQEDRDE